MDYSIDIKDRGARVILSGKLTYESNDAFQLVMKQLEEESIQRITIDLHRIEFVDSAGLGMLLLMKDRFKQTPISIVGAQDQVRKILILTKLNEVFSMQ